MAQTLRTRLYKTGGRDNSGRLAVRHIGGGQKQFLRFIDFKRSKRGIEGKVVSFEYDPNRTVDIALVQYNDGEKRYILKPVGLELGSEVVAADNAELHVGNALPIGKIPVGTFVHNIELTPGKGGQVVRSAGSAASILAREEGFTHVKMPSGELRKIDSRCFATIGQLSNIEHKNEQIGKAGRSRLMGRKPGVRGVAMDPRSHPHGGGEARSGIGMPTPKTYYGRPAVGKTRKKGKFSDKFIIARRKNKSGSSK